MPGGTFFVYVRAPKACGPRRFTSAEEASHFLIQEHSIICVPWDNVGAYLRFSATYEAQNEVEEDALMSEMKRRLGSLSLSF